MSVSSPGWSGFGGCARPRAPTRSRSRSLSAAGAGSFVMWALPAMKPNSVCSAPKKIAAALRISFALRNSAFSRLRRLRSSDCFTAHTRALSGIDLGAPHPRPHRLERAHAQLARHSTDRSPLRPVLRCYLSDHPNSPLPKLLRILAARAMIQILPTQGASGHAGRSQSAAPRPRNISPHVVICRQQPRFDTAMWLDQELIARSVFPRSLFQRLRRTPHGVPKFHRNG
ncbi:hypothetical protein MSIMFB_04388 [Mycobacterium simulans]|uniref:Uncharacterized protein n=1 Tax=Mycobacterium simulans TaxID=627089 RepID=A0A7Z7IQL2_9MYCO|nr:hypothetical protein MSIMFB_04388 [Mycobacterium simulans]